MIPATDRLHLLRQTQLLLRHGVAPDRVFMALSSTTVHSGLAETLQRMGHACARGQHLWQAMAAWPDVFDDTLVALVREGERHGQLPEAFAAAYRHLEFDQAMRQRLQQAWLKLALGLALAASLMLVLWPQLPTVAGVLLLGLMAGLLQWRLPLLGLRLWRRLPGFGPLLQHLMLARVYGCLALGQRVAMAWPDNLRLAAQAGGQPLPVSTAGPPAPGVARSAAAAAPSPDAAGTAPGREAEPPATDALAWLVRAGLLDQTTRRLLQRRLTQAGLTAGLVELTRHHRLLAERADAQLQRTLTVLLPAAALGAPLVVGLGWLR